MVRPPDFDKNCSCMLAALDLALLCPSCFWPSLAFYAQLGPSALEQLLEGQVFTDPSKANQKEDSTEDQTQQRKQKGITMAHLQYNFKRLRFARLLESALLTCS